MGLQLSAPFGKAGLCHGQVVGQVIAQRAPADLVVNKWDMFKDLTECRRQLEISDRALAVIYALLTCVPKTALSPGTDLVVFASNAELCRRANAVGESTFRRHLATLVERGLVVRRDSPNGKRYARRGVSGEVSSAFGIDLNPLIARAGEFAGGAREARRLRGECKELKESISVARRDIAKMIAVGAAAGVPFDWEQAELRYQPLNEPLKRQAPAKVLRALNAELLSLSSELSNALECLAVVDNVSGNDSQTERHIRDSISESPSRMNQGLRGMKQQLSFLQEPGAATEVSSSEVRPEQPSQVDDFGGTAVEQIAAGAGPAGTRDPARGLGELNSKCETVDLAQVVHACPDATHYVRGGIRSWGDLVVASDTIRKALGVGPQAWGEARRVLGEAGAAVTAAAILQQSDRIKNPGGYLRSLTAKATLGQFAVKPMLNALSARQLAVPKARAAV